MVEQLTLPTVDDIPVSHLKKFEDVRGFLTVAELADLPPFNIARLFYVQYVPVGQERGGHAHKLCSQFIICLDGQVRVDVFDGLKERQSLLNPADCVWIKPGIYASEHFLETNSAILVLCDRKFELEDYVEGKDVFRRYRETGK